MKPESRGKTFGINVGGASIVLMLLVLGMTVFALLAIRSSLNERKLAEKTAESVQEYYGMDGEAARVLAQIDELLSGAYAEPEAPVPAYLIEEALYELEEVTDVQVENGYVKEISYKIDSPVRENVSLTVRLECSGSEEESQEWKVKVWKVQTEEPEGYELELLD